MDNENIKEILDKLKDSVDNPIDTEVDQFTEEAYDVPNYFCLDPTTNDCKILLDYITRLQENYERIYNENCILKEKHNITDISLLDENYNLKKIIIELEKHLESKYYEWKDSDNEIIKESAYEDLRILDYLKELKGDN